MKNIMIKSAIATAVIAATTVTTIADVKVYGRVRVVAACNDTGNSATDECSLENRSSRFGIKASSEISEGVSAFGRYEFGVNGDTAALPGNANNRLSYVGIKGGFGEISMGTRWSPLYLATISYVDPTNAFGGTWTGSYADVDFRHTDTINYKNKFGAANVGVQIEMASGSAANDVDAITVGGSFKAGSATIGLGFQDRADQFSRFAIHARSKFGPVSLGATYSATDRELAADSDTATVKAALGYSMGGGKSINATYSTTDFDIAGLSDPSTIAVEFAHNMGAGFKWFAGFDSTDTDVAGADNANRYGVGMRYDF